MHILNNCLYEMIDIQNMLFEINNKVELSFEQKMALVEKAFKNGEITRSEQIDIEDDLIMEQAFIEAEMWEF